MKEFILGDCMNYLPSYDDNYFDLAIVDPPYGGSQHINFRFGTGDQVYENRKPDPEYFEQLFRVSKNQIIWGGNYFTDNLPVSRFWICWQKGNPVKSFSDFELAWGSFNKVCVNAKLDSYGFNHADKKVRNEKTIHPTQKPVSLYKWLLREYAKTGDLILDTHVGSASSLIACESMGFDYVGFEIDKDYYEEAKKRMGKGIQTALF